MVGWKKDVELDNGVTASYWVLVRLDVNVSSGKAKAYYCGYMSQEAHESGKDELIQNSCEIDFSGFDPDGALASAVAAMIQARQ